MQGERLNKISMYHSPQGTQNRHHKSTGEYSFRAASEEDPLRQQLTSYLSRFRDEQAPSNLLVNNTKALPTLYAKAKKYSVFTLKRKPNRSFQSPFSPRPLEMHPTLRRLKL